MELSRRRLLGVMAMAGAGGPLGVRVSPATAHVSAGSAHPAVETGPWSEAEEQDRRRVIAVGFTDDEADAWLLLNRGLAALLALPEQHPSDRPDVVQAAHVLQRQLLVRPTYRNYEELQHDAE